LGRRGTRVVMKAETQKLGMKKKKKVKAAKECPEETGGNKNEVSDAAAQSAEPAIPQKAKKKAEPQKLGMKKKKKVKAATESPEETGGNKNEVSDAAAQSAKPAIPQKAKKKAKKAAPDMKLKEQKREAKRKKAAIAKEIEEDEKDAEDELPSEAEAEETGAPEKKTKANRLAKEPQEPREPRGVLYIGHVPNGFHEREWIIFFSQFGEVTRIRLARSKKTGNSKGYGWIEFEDLEVAKIVAEAMDKYWLGGRNLVVQLVPPDEVKKGLFRVPKVAKGNLEQRRRKKHNDLANERPMVEVDGELLPQWTTNQVKRKKEKVEKLKAALEVLSIRYTVDDDALNGEGEEDDDEIIVPVSSEELRDNVSVPSSALLPESERPVERRFKRKHTATAGGSEGAPVTEESATGPGHVEHGSEHTVRKVRRKDYHWH